MAADDGRRMVEAFYYVRDVYKNILQMLMSCDALLQDRGFSPYQWAPMEGSKWVSWRADDWLAHRAVRQYYPRGRKDKEVLTVGAVLWNPGPQEVQEPLCVASMMAAKSTPDAIYWVSLLGWKVLPMNEVRLLGRADAKGHEETFDSIVADGRILSIAVPLLDVTSSETLEKRVIEPLLARLERTSDKTYVMPKE